MDKDYEILKLNNEPYDFLIIATSYINPLGYINEIGDTIRMQKALLLFDLTLINGVNTNRYVRYDYEKGKNKTKSCKIVSNVEDEIKSISHNYFVNNKDLVDNSVISEPLKFLVKEGMV